MAAVCFNTSMIGYLEIISDPAYAGSIVAMTYPQIGNYGVVKNDLQSDGLTVAGLVVRDICDTPSNYRSETSLPAFLAEQGVVAITDVDTRALSTEIREQGAMRAVISTTESDPAALLAKLQAQSPEDAKGLVKRVSTEARYHYFLDKEYAEWLSPIAEPTARLAVYDCGVPRNTLRNLVRVGCSVTIVPFTTSAADVLETKPNGVLFSSGPGEAQELVATIEAARGLMGKVPVLGIGLGLAVMAIAAGGKVEPLKAGHHGANYPVKDLVSGKVLITTQNHGAALAFDSLGPLVPELSQGVSAHPASRDLRFWISQGVAPVVQNAQFGRIRLTQVNLNDGSVEGLEFLDIPAFAVQYNPQIPPGPIALPGRKAVLPAALAASPLSAFVRLMEGRADYLYSLDEAAPKAVAAAATEGEKGAAKTDTPVDDEAVSEAAVEVAALAEAEDAVAVEVEVEVEVEVAAEGEAPAAPEVAAPEVAATEVAATEVAATDPDATADFAPADLGTLFDPDAPDGTPADEPEPNTPAAPGSATPDAAPTESEADHA